MSLPVWIALAVLGGFGAVARFGVDSVVSTRFGTGFPLGILAVNLSGAFTAGLLLGAVVADDAYDVLVLGLLGGFTTFSTWMLQTHELGQRGLSERAFLNITVSLLAGLLLVWLGRELGAALI